MEKIQMTLQERLAQIGTTSICPAAIIVRDGKILSGYRNYTPDKYKDISVWTHPGGRCEPGETVEAALRRETAEETGITDLQILDYIGEAPGAKAGDTVRVFYCQTNQEAQNLEPEKFSEWRWIPLQEYFKGAPYDTLNPGVYGMTVAYLKSKT